MKTLFADCGSTKCDWALVDSGNPTVRRTFQTGGLNLAIASEDTIIGFVEQAAAAIQGCAQEELSGELSKVEFYGAGAKINSGNDARLAELLSARLGGAVAVDTDLAGAAKALFGDCPGIACILGTGSNSGFYDGRRIIRNTPPLGFILGDEGSGASLGRRLVNGVFKGLLPPELISSFNAEYSLTKEELIARVYRQPGANFFLAGFTKFLSANIAHPAISGLVEAEFRNFFTHNLLQYPVEKAQPSLGFVGSIAYYFAPRLRGVAGEFFPELDADAIAILRSPITHLK